MSTAAKSVKELRNIDEWHKFVDQKCNWDGNCDVVRFLQWRWLQLTQGIGVVVKRLPQHDSYWSALCELEKEEYDQAPSILSTPSLNTMHGNGSHANTTTTKRRSDNLDHDNGVVTEKMTTCQATKDGSSEICDKTFSSYTSLRRHLYSQHRPNRPQCSKCQKKFPSAYELKVHHCGKRQHIVSERKMTRTNRGSKDVDPIEICQDAQFHVDALWRTMGFTRFRFTPVEEEADYDLALRNVVWRVKNALALAVNQYGAVKYQLKAFVQFQQAKEPAAKGSHYFAPSMQLLSHSRGVEEQLENFGADISNRIGSYINQGSGWAVENVGFFDLDVIPFRPLHGASYIELPSVLANKKAIINVQNQDNKCFQWALLAALHRVRIHPERVSHYLQYEGTLDFTDVQFPVTLNHVGDIESANGISINVFGCDRDGLHPLHITKQRDRPDLVINLLMLKQGDNLHYCWIKSLDSLLFSQMKQKTRHFHCPFCLFGFTSDERRQSHMSYCQTGDQKVQMPVEGTMLTFQNVKNQLVLPLVIYADFECFLKPIVGCAPRPDISSTTKTHQHVPNSFAACCVEKCGCSRESRFTKGTCYRDDDSVEQFLRYCLETGEAHQQMLDNVQPLAMGKSDWRDYNRSSTCHICKEGIRKTENDWNKVRDHCHICGKFRGPAHSRCNILYRRQRDVPVVLHNLRRYDGHLIMQQLGVLARKRNLDIECVPRGFEDYLSFSLVAKHQLPNNKIVSWKLRFIDSFQFLSSSLEKLAESLLGQNHSGQNKFHCLEFVFDNPTQRQLLLRKGVYPYEYMDSADRFDEPTLPAKDDFYSSLRMEGIKDADYQHALNVWKEFGLADMGAYHDLYLQTDVVLLTDVFENFRASCVNHYGLDPAHYITLPSFAWDACLKYTDVKLELLSDPDMYGFFENAIRGGVSMISSRFSQANNPLVPDYSVDDENKAIMYFDANNLYGWSMSQPMPVSGFSWLTEMEIQQLPNWDDIGDTDEIGYVLEVDLGYPDELHDNHNDYPLAPESIVITDEMLSPYSVRLKSKLQILSGKIKKLTPNLLNKSRYVVTIATSNIT